MTVSAKTLLLVASAAALIASCTTAPAEQSQNPRAARELADALEGRVAGQPQNCISNYPDTQVQVIDDQTILYDEGSTIYLQKPRERCLGIGSGSRTLVARQVGTSQMCDGDINETVNLQTRIGGAPCVFGPFVPYTRPRS